MVVRTVGALEGGLFIKILVRKTVLPRGAKGGDKFLGVPRRLHKVNIIASSIGFMHVARNRFVPALFGAAFFSCSSSAPIQDPEENPLHSPPLSETSHDNQEEAFPLETLLQDVRLIRGEGAFTISPRPLQLEETGFAFAHEGRSYVLTDDAVSRYPELLQQYVNPAAQLDGAMRYSFGNAPALFLCNNQNQDYALFLTRASPAPVAVGDSSALRPGTMLYGIGHSVGEQFIAEGFVAHPNQVRELQLNEGEFPFYSENFHGGMPLFAEDEQGNAYFVGIFVAHVPEYGVNIGRGIPSIMQDLEEQHCLSGMALQQPQYRAVGDE